jgi:hypothetical protein
MDSGSFSFGWKTLSMERSVRNDGIAARRSGVASSPIGVTDQLIKSRIVSSGILNMFFLEQITNDMGLFLTTVQMTPNFLHQFILVGQATLAERVGFHVLVEKLKFARVQFGTVTGQVNQAEARGVSSLELFDWGRAMNRMSVNDQVNLVLFVV